MALNRVLFSSAKQTWQTPKAVYQTLDAEFRFDDDPCPTMPMTDGLTRRWGGVVFCNPPYKQIAVWVRKAWEEAQTGKTVVLLIPSRTDTRWWHEYVMTATEIRFIRGRLRFEGAKHSAPFPSVIVIWQATPSAAG